MHYNASRGKNHGLGQYCAEAHYSVLPFLATLCIKGLTYKMFVVSCNSADACVMFEGLYDGATCERSDALLRPLPSQVELLTQARLTSNF